MSGTAASDVPAPRQVPADAPGRRWPPRLALAGYLGAGAAALAGSVLVYLVDPAEPGHYPTCPFRQLTGLDCPGCGTMRGLHQLLHGNIAAAADYNIFFVIAAPLLVVGWAVTVARLLGWRVPRLPQLPTFAYVAIPVLIVAFWIVRNTPGPVGGWLAS
ncbi:MAG: DUF2752 domain-containing protein [Frankia sp.]|nr:DUF2752 domain-containing protein [Frankia sp.]